MESRRPGRTAPVTGLPPGVDVGGLGRRLGACLVDSVIVLVAAVVLGRVVPTLDGVPGTVVAVVTVAVVIGWALVCWSMLAGRAASPGMRLTRVQLVGFHDGRPVGWARVLLRWLVVNALAATGLGLVLMLFFLLRHPRHQGWHDQAAHAVVIAQRQLARSRPPEAAGQPVDRPSPAGAAAAGPAPATVAGANDTVATGTVATDTVATDTVADDDETSPTEPDVPVTAVAPSPPAILDGWRAELDDGREVVVEGLVLLGRSPQPATGEEDAQLVKLADDSRTVSKTHLALGVDDAGAFVVDRGSTNGSTVTTPDGVSSDCTPGTAVSVREGSIVSLGNHWLRIRRHQD